MEHPARSALFDPAIARSGHDDGRVRFRSRRRGRECRVKQIETLHGRLPGRGVHERAVLDRQRDQVVAGIRLRKEIEGEFWLILSGLVSIALGVFLVARPGAGALSVLWLIATYAIVFGAILVVLAFRVRSFASRLTAATRG